jgi:hypothetical protein
MMFRYGLPFQSVHDSAVNPTRGSLSGVWGDDHEYGPHIHQNLKDLKEVLAADPEPPES